MSYHTPLFLTASNKLQRTGERVLIKLWLYLMDIRG